MLRANSIVLYFFGLILASNAELPSYITKCKYKDPELNTCLKEQANNAFRHILKGDESIGVPSLFPISYPRIYLRPNHVNFALEIKNSKVYGLELYHIKDISIDFKKQTFDLTITGPGGNWTGTYNASGQLYNSTYNHRGDLNITFENAEGYFSAEFEPKNFDGLFYIQLKNEVFTFKSDKIIYNFVSRNSRDLKEAKDLTHKLNEEYPDLNNEFLPTSKLLSAGVFTTVINNILRTEPMCTLFDY